MRSLLLALAAAVLLATPAHPDVTYYLAPPPLGNDNNDGLSAATPWRTIAWANTHLPAPNTANGNVFIQLANGSYAGFNQVPYPLNTAIDGKYFHWRGNVTDPAAVVIGDGSNWVRIKKNNTIFQGLKIVSPKLIFGDRDSSALICRGVRVWDCILQSNSNIELPLVRYASFLRTKFDAVMVDFGNGKFEAWPDPAYCRADTISDCTFATLGNNMTTGDTNALQFFPADSMVFRFNRMHFDMPPQPGSAGNEAFRAQYSRWNALRGNFWGIRTQDSEDRFNWKFRNYAHSNTVECDTVIQYGPAWSLSTVSLGGEGDSSGASTLNMVIDSCLFWTANGSAFTFAQTGLNNTTITNNVFVSQSDQAIEFNAVQSFQGSNLIAHNTFIGPGWYGVINAEALSPRYTAPGAGTSQLVMRDNIFKAVGLDPILECNHDHCDWGWCPAASMVIHPLTDTTRTTWYKNRHDLNSYIATPGDRAYSWTNNGHFCAGVTLNSQKDNGFPAKDSLSTYGDSKLFAFEVQPLNHNVAIAQSIHNIGPPVDPYGTVNPFFSMMPMFDSPVRDAASDGRDIGAIEFVALKRLEIVARDTLSPHEYGSDTTRKYISFIGTSDSSTVFRSFGLKNAGWDSLTVTSVEIDRGLDYAGLPGISVAWPTVPQQIMPGQELTAWIKYTRPGYDPVNGLITIGDCTLGVVIKSNAQDGIQCLQVFTDPEEQRVPDLDQ